MNDDYQNFSRIIRKDLSAFYVMLFTMCHISLKNCLEGESEYQQMVYQGIFNSTMLHILIKKKCNGLTGVVVDDMIGNTLEYLCNCMFIRGDECYSLLKHLEVSSHRFDTLKQTRFTFTIESIIDYYLAKLISRVKQGPVTHKKMLGMEELCFRRI